MIKDYLKTALRNVRNSKVYSLINITGLVVGLACFILLSLFVFDEMNYDSFNKNANQIYRIYVHSNFNGEETNNSKSPAPLGPALERIFPEVINSTRIGYFGQYDIKYEDKSFREFRAYTADSTYFSIFTLPFIYGNPKTALKDPNSVVMTESTAEKYFGKENPLGKTLIVNDNDLFVITGVMKDFPAKSHFSCDFLISMSTYPVTEKNSWLDLWYTTYIVLKEGTDTNSFEEKLQSVVKNYVGPEAEKVLGYQFDDFLLNNNEYVYHIQPLKSIYLYSLNKYGIDLNTEWGNVKSSSITYSYLFMAIGLFILLIAIFNFMNLSTAKSEKRSNEVSIRKTLGSGKMMLIIQFITESVITCSFAVLFAIALVQIVLPVFNNFIGRDLKLEFFNNFYTLPAFILFTVVVGIIAGSYPAFYLSSFQPAHIIKSKNGGYKNKSLRSLLVITQFAISITLIIGTLFIKRQLEYIQNKNLGFNKENLITINNANVLGNKIEAFKNEILSNSDIKSATTSSLMFRSGIPGNTFLYNKTSGTDVVSSQFLDVDYDFPETYQIEMKEGRFFSRDFLTDSNAVVINEAAVKDFNAKDPIGKYIAQIDASKGNLNKYTIIGVIKDFNYESLHQKVRPLAFYLSPVRQASSVLTIRMSSEHIIQTTKYLEQTWNDYTTQANFNYTFVEQNLENMYRNESRVGTITTVFSSLAIFIACLGLLGLVAFITEQKTKEIGIRKVNGAKVSEIMTMLNKDFVKWVAIAFIIATPIAYYTMNKWLENFAYKTTLSWWIFALAGVLALGIALLTVSWQSWRAAIRNPVEALRYE